MIHVTFYLIHIVYDFYSCLIVYLQRIFLLINVFVIFLYTLFFFFLLLRWTLFSIIAMKIKLYPAVPHAVFEDLSVSIFINFFSSHMFGVWDYQWLFIMLEIQHWEAKFIAFRRLGGLHGSKFCSNRVVRCSLSVFHYYIWCFWTNVTHWCHLQSAICKCQC